MTKLSEKQKEVIEKMRGGERLYKFTGSNPYWVCFDTSGEDVSNSLFRALFEKKIITVDDASALETWYCLTDLGKSLPLK